ncbi:hypothetical protein K493DRAFT_313719, partial [Basidiobolus meristosporus CBS 931.73]
MNAEELASYQCQLDQVKLALQSDPKTFLQQQNLSPTKPKSIKTSPRRPPTNEVFTTASSEHTWKVGDSCLVRWPVDGKFYEGVIVAISPSGDFTVTYKGYGNTESVTIDDLKPPKSEGRKRGAESVFGTKHAPAKKANPLPKNVALKQKQQNWLNFVNKKTKTPAVNKKSIFASPVSVEGKVGVTRSGKPMTQFAAQHRHVFKV